MRHPISPSHPDSPISEADVKAFVHLVPPSGTHLFVLLGTRDALVLINAWPGVQVVVPKGPCNNAGGARRWAQMVAVIGEDAMLKLSTGMGGGCLEIPTLDALRKARRNHAILTKFDHLTAKAPAGEGMSKARAVQELSLIYAPITWRHLNVILDRPTHAPDIQNNLFE